ncbi:MAG: NADH-quinone oxidoreductase subunit K [Candidatus Bathyarchaeia archaeon]|jgi:NADH:ubiquinone oxidoreductase subunit K
MIDLTFYVIFAIALYMVGMYCLATKRNMLRLILGIEILINAANINFITFAAYAMPGFVDPMGNSFVCISIGLAGAVSAVALVIVVLAYRHYGTLDVTELRRLRG